MLWGIDASVVFVLKEESKLTGREGGGRVFGSNEVNVESWRPLKRLVGHTAGMWPSSAIRWLTRRCDRLGVVKGRFDDGISRSG